MKEKKICIYFQILNVEFKNSIQVKTLNIEEDIYLLIFFHLRNLETP